MTQFKMRDTKLKTKTIDLIFGTWSLILSCRLSGKFFKKRLQQNTVVSCAYCKILRTAFFIGHLRLFLTVILFLFCLLCKLSPVFIVGASCLNYIGPCRWFWVVLDCFSSFLTLVNVPFFVALMNGILISSGNSIL